MPKPSLEEQVIAAFIDRDSQRNVEAIYQAVDAESMAELDRCIDRLLEEKKLARFFRVVGPSGVGLADYHAREDIPAQLEDDRYEGDLEESIVLFDVTPGRIRTLFRLGSYWEDQEDEARIRRAEEAEPLTFRCQVHSVRATVQPKVFTGKLFRLSLSAVPELPQGYPLGGLLTPHQPGVPLLEDYELTIEPLHPHMKTVLVRGVVRGGGKVSVVFDAPGLIGVKLVDPWDGEPKYQHQLFLPCSGEEGDPVRAMMQEGAELVFCLAPARDEGDEEE